LKGLKNISRVYFYKKKFNEVITHLNMVNYDDIWYNVNSKILLLAVYYELEETFVLESTLEAYLLFLRRDKLLENAKKENYLNFAIILKKINKTNSLSKLLALKEDTINKKIVSNKPWLLEKIEELINKK